MFIHIYIYTYTYISMHTHMCINIHTCIRVHVYKQTYLGNIEQSTLVCEVFAKTVLVRQKRVRD